MLDTGGFNRVYATRWDRVPIACELTEDESGWSMRTEGDSSVYAYFPWKSPQLGELVIQTATLAHRPEPYDLLIELARGSLNQTQNYLAECEQFGLAPEDRSSELLQEARQLFAKVVTNPTPHGGSEDAAQVVEHSLALNSQLVARLTSAVQQQESIGARRPDRGVRLTSAELSQEAQQAIDREFQVLHVPIVWAEIEGDEGRFDWSGSDRLFEMADHLGKRIVAGPILGSDAQHLPNWALARRDQFDRFRDSVSRFVNQVAARYAARVDQWYAVGGLNTPTGLGLNDQLRILLAAGIVERLRRSDPNTPRLVAIDRPWGEYLQQPTASLSPLGFLDALIRADIGVDAIGMQMNLGSWSNGTTWRHPLAIVQRINEFASLEKPITLLLRSGTDEIDAMRQLAQLVNTNASVAAVVWNQWMDAGAEFPHSGLWTETGPSVLFEQLWGSAKKDS